MQILESDPRVTQRFLESQEGVIEADVWFSGSKLIAEITLSDHAQWTTDSLTSACEKALGPGATPDLMVLIEARLIAA